MISRSALLLAATLIAVPLAACSSGSLAPGLSARLDQGAQINRADAVNIINHFRTESGTSALAESGDLDQIAQNLAAQYGKSGMTPSRPDGVVDIRYSAGYPTFGETFSGWRNSAADAKALNSPNATRIGIGAYYSENTPYGAYWVVILG